MDENHMKVDVTNVSANERVAVVLVAGNKLMGAVNALLKALQGFSADQVTFHIHSAQGEEVYVMRGKK